MSQSERILQILLHFSKKEEICIGTLANFFKVDQRTIQRDIKILKRFLSDSLISHKKGCYKLIEISDISSILLNAKNSQDIKDFFEFLTFFDENFFPIFKDLSSSFLKKIKKEAKRIYHIHENPIEKPPKTITFERIKHAVKFRKHIDIVYFENYRRDLKRVKPLKIVYAKGNWYLASLTENYKMNNGFKFFRLNFIKSVKILSETFQTDEEALHFIENFQSLFQNYKTPSYEVKLKVDAIIARHFKVKKYLKSQQITPLKNGDIIVSYKINNDMEILPLVKTWIPHIKIISPNHLKEKLLKDIKTLLDDI